MCPNNTLRAFKCGGEDVVPDTREPICLFRQHCEEVGHSHVVFNRLDEECPVCSARKQFTPEAMKAQGLLLQHRKVSRAPTAAKSPPAHVIRCLNLIAKQELAAYLSENISAGKCKSVLYYILNLPKYMDHAGLIEAFGAGAGGFYSAAKEKEFTTVAAKKGFEEKIKKGLQQGAELRKLEKIEAQKQWEQEKAAKKEAAQEKAAACKEAAREKASKVVLIGRHISLCH